VGAIGIIGVQEDGEVMARVVAAIRDAGDSATADVLESCSLSWWTEPNQEIGLLGNHFAVNYPEHYALITIPHGAYDFLADEYDAIAEAVAVALGTDYYSPLRGLTLEEREPEPAPPREPVPSSESVPMLTRGPYSLTPIEAALYDELCETGLTFSVQTTLHSVDRECRPDFIVFGTERPIVVEVDGHAYHHTRAQRTSDAQRGRWLQGQGFEVVRFTGSEIHADVGKCVRELRELVKQRRVRD